MKYLIGDLQGCCDALEQFLIRVGFSRSRDHLFVLGDLVNRGPRSADVLRTLSALDSSATCLLGNHDLHLLAVAAGARPLHRSDTLQEILDAPEREEWLSWLHHQQLAHRSEGWLMVHAGVVPQWTADLTLSLAREVETVIRSSDASEFFMQMYGNSPDRWTNDLAGIERLRFIVNTLTRIRFCSDEGVPDFKAKDGADQAPAGFKPWFEVESRKTRDTPMAFGHWSTLGLIDRPRLLALDTGCVWGGALTGVRLSDSDHEAREIIQIPCDQAMKPG